MDKDGELHGDTGKYGITVLANCSVYKPFTAGKLNCLQNQSKNKGYNVAEVLGYTVLWHKIHHGLPPTKPIN